MNLHPTKSGAVLVLYNQNNEQNAVALDTNRNFETVKTEYSARSIRSGSHN